MRCTACTLAGISDTTTVTAIKLKATKHVPVSGEFDPVRSNSNDTRSRRFVFSAS
jgi:hypothetical protein